MCQEYGIIFIETEENYTSIASFLDGEDLPNHGEIPDDWKPSGKRIKRCSAAKGGFPHERLPVRQRGLYKSGNSCFVNADYNGAANIIRKVSRKPGLNLSQLFRGTLTCPQRVCLWSANTISL
uniref:hypothetical protein n=1 Tax=Okeania sp. SIO2F4 TaxID=2607790 RepID=UPI0025F78491|nr:hypothetical protein [Okeania sp. SIO2F4]